VTIFVCDSGIVRRTGRIAPITAHAAEKAHDLAGMEVTEGVDGLVMKLCEGWGHGLAARGLIETRHIAFRGI